MGDNDEDGLCARRLLLIEVLEVERDRGKVLETEDLTREDRHGADETVGSESLHEQHLGKMAKEDKRGRRHGRKEF